MPRLSRAIERSVFFLFRIDPQTGKRTGPHGSGFFVSRKSESLPGEVHYYAVINKHVACDLGASDIRINTSRGKTRIIELGPDEWQFLHSGDDLAVADVTPLLRIKSDRIACNSEDTFVTQDALARLDIGPGDDAFMCGLFVDHHGSSSSNVPSFRFGNISMLADNSAPIEMEGGATRPAHLVDTRSRTGFSGSPVFIYRVPMLDLTRLTNMALPVNVWEPSFYGDIWSSPFLGLFGVHCGQFKDIIDVRKAANKPTKETQIEKFGDPIQEGDKLRIESSMTVVVPAWCITSLLNLDTFAKARDKRDEQRMERAERRPYNENDGS